MPLKHFTLLRTTNKSGIFKSRVKRIDSGYKLIEVLSGRRGSADTVVNIATVYFRFGAVVVTEKFVFNVAYENISVAGSHFGAHGHSVDLLKMTVRE